MSISNTVKLLKRGYLKTLKSEQLRIQSMMQPMVQHVTATSQPVQVPINMVPVQPVIQPIIQPVIQPVAQTITEQAALPASPVQKPGQKLPVIEIEIPIEIPRLIISSKEKIERVIAPREEEIRVNLVYPLVPKNPSKGEKILAFARIFWDPKENKHIYELNEPKMTENVKTVYKKIKDLLEQKLDVDFSKLKKFEAKDYLHKNIEEIIQYYKIKLTEDEKDALHYYIERDFTGLEKIQPLLNDEDIEDISCDGIGIPIFVYHRNSKLGSLETNVTFDSAEELDSFIIKMTQICGKSISVASPLVNGSLPDGSRIQATLATDIARRGSNFTIRKFTEEPLTPVHFLNYGTVDVPMLAFLWLAVDYGKSILVSGGTASGKTSMLNVLSLFIKPDMKIVSIEDTPELKLPHPHWVPHVARTAIATEGFKKFSEVDMFDLLKESLRQRPDYIVVGEVRGKEAFVLFQEMATGHPSLATIHAETATKLVDRLTTAPISLPANLVESLDLVIFLLRVRYKNRHLRRVNEIYEIIGIDDRTKMPVFNRIFKWNSVNDTFEIDQNSTILIRICKSTGISEDQIKQELERRMYVLKWMQMKNITNYKDVFTVLNVYDNYPERVLNIIKGEM
jgi:flagellar protein FlaI